MAYFPIVRKLTQSFIDYRIERALSPKADLTPLVIAQLLSVVKRPVLSRLFKDRDILHIAITKLFKDSSPMIFKNLFSQFFTKLFGNLTVEVSTQALRVAIFALYFFSNHHYLKGTAGYFYLFSTPTMKPDMLDVGKYLNLVPIEHVNFRDLLLFYSTLLLGMTIISTIRERILLHLRKLQTSSLQCFPLLLYHAITLPQVAILQSSIGKENEKRPKWKALSNIVHEVGISFLMAQFVEVCLEKPVPIAWRWKIIQVVARELFDLAQSPPLEENVSKRRTV